MSAHESEEVPTLPTQSSGTPKTALANEARQASNSLRLLANYSGSSSSENDSDHERQKKSRSQKEGPLPIPSAIHEMFEAEVGVNEKSDHCERERLFFRGNSSLGFFEAEELSSSEDEVRGEFSAGLKQSGPGNSHTLEPRDTRRTREDSELCLTSYTCWKCSNVGHLPQDCTVRVSAGREGGGVRTKVPKAIQALYAACREIKGKKGQRCADCGVHSNLACCLDCRYVQVWVLATFWLLAMTRSS